MDQERYVAMFETTTHAKKYLSQILNDNPFNNFNSFNENFSYLFNKRISNDLWLRPYVVRSVFELFEKKRNWQSIIPVIAAAEIFNISTYQSNIVFDDKINDNNISNINQFIASFISFNLTNKIFLQSLNTNDKSKLNCINILNKNNQDVYYGQFIDVNILIKSNITKIGTMLQEEFLSIYMQRCDLIGGSTVENCAFWAMELAEVEDNATRIAMLKLFRTWGKIMQMVNDLSDFTIFIDRTNYKRYTDVRAGKITLPLYFILKRMNKIEIEKFIFEKNHNTDSLDAFFSKYLFVDSPVILDVFNVIKNEWNVCRELLIELHHSCEVKKLSYLFENVFLTRFVKPFFSNKLIKTIKNGRRI